MLNICLCDDDMKIIDYYSMVINKVLNKNNFEFNIEKFTSGENLLFELDGNYNKFSIIIIDILMKKISGIEVAKILRSNGYNAIIIFLTTSKEYAIDSFEVEPLNYILKKDNYKFEDVILKAARRTTEEANKKIIISTKTQYKIINFDKIIYIESFNKKVILHKLNSDTDHINNSLNDIYLRIKEFGFVQIHKSYVVNIKYVESFNSQECKLKNNIVLSIGRKYLKDFRNLILENEFKDLMI